MSELNLDLVAIGNAMVDVLVEVPESFIEEQSASGMIKGTMNLIDEARAVELYAAMPPGIEMSGGSAGNTIAGFASFGGNGSYIGKTAQDQLGDVFRHDMKAMGVRYDTTPLVIGAPTGRCLVLVTPDADRTMNSFLGSGVELSIADIDEELISAAQVTYMEGYLFDPPQAKEAYYKAAEIAHKAERKVSLTLSDPFCVDRHRDDFKDLVKNHVDILFANEEEIMSLYQVDTFEQAMDEVMSQCDIVALTRGDKGSVVLADFDITEVPAESVSKVVDTTGAGDQYAAGFLYGFTQGMTLDMCGHLGSKAAAEVISHIGPRPAQKYADFLNTQAA